MENMLVGLSTTVIGMLIVFAVLILLAVIVSLFKYMGAPAKPKTPAPAAPIAEPAPVVTAAAESQSQEQAQLTAVIAAALAAYLGEEGGDSSLTIRSIRRVQGWNDAGRREQQSRL